MALVTQGVKTYPVSFSVLTLQTCENARLY